MVLPGGKSPVEWGDSGMNHCNRASLKVLGCLWLPMRVCIGTKTLHSYLFSCESCSRKCHSGQSGMVLCVEQSGRTEILPLSCRIDVHQAAA
jgi:hypothetical protein